MRTNKTCYACLSFSSSALLVIFLQLECLFVLFARKAVYWIVFWKSNCLTSCRFIWKLIFWLLRRKVTELFVFLTVGLFARKVKKSKNPKNIEKLLFDYLSCFFEKWLFDFLREKWLFDFLSFFSKCYFLTFCAKNYFLTFWGFFFEKLLFDFLREK